MTSSIFWLPPTPREAEVLRLLTQGKSTGEISGTLQVTPSTVRVHIHHLILKARLSTRLELVVACLADRQQPASVPEHIVALGGE